MKAKRERRKKIGKRFLNPYSCFCKFLSYLCCCFGSKFCPWVVTQEVTCDHCGHQTCPLCKKNYHGERTPCLK